MSAVVADPDRGFGPSLTGGPIGLHGHAADGVADVDGDEMTGDASTCSSSLGDYF